MTRRGEEHDKKHDNWLRSHNRTTQGQVSYLYQNNVEQVSKQVSTSKVSLSTRATFNLHTFVKNGNLCSLIDTILTLPTEPCFTSCNNLATDGMYLYSIPTHTTRLREDQQQHALLLSPLTSDHSHDRLLPTSPLSCSPPPWCKEVSRRARATKSSAQPPP